MNIETKREMARDFINNKNKCALFGAVGLGKTKLALDWLDYREAGKVLIVAPKSVCDKMNWEKESFLWGKLHQFETINFESVHKVDVKKYDTIIIDESHRIKNRTSKTFKEIKKGNYKNVLLLTATPTDKSNEEYYSQLYLIDALDKAEMKQPKLFVNKYCEFELQEMRGRYFNKFKCNKNTEELKERISNKVIFIDKGERDYIVDSVYIQYGKTKEYNKILKDRVVFSEDKTDEPILLDSVGKKFAFERSALCGRYKGIELTSNKNAHLEKMEMIIGSDSFIVFYNFVDELEQIKKSVFREIVEINGDKKEFDKINKEKPQCVAIQLQSGSTGIDGLQYMNTAIYYSPPVSSTLFEQSKGRLDRGGQTSDVTYYLFCGENSIEEDIYKSLEKKQDYRLSFYKGGL